MSGAMTGRALERIYLAYLDCLNRQDWQNLGQFVATTVIHNGRSIGLSGYRAMLEADYRAIPDLRFAPALIMADPPHVGCRLLFDCSPVGMVFGLPVNGRRVRFAENVFYRFENAVIKEVWSIIDQSAIAGQLADFAAEQ
jgi:predicted ester cyclase